MFLQVARGRLELPTKGYESPALPLSYLAARAHLVASTADYISARFDPTCAKGKRDRLREARFTARHSTRKLDRGSGSNECSPALRDHSLSLQQRHLHGAVECSHARRQPIT